MLDIQCMRMKMSLDDTVPGTMDIRSDILNKWGKYGKLLNSVGQTQKEGLKVCGRRGEG